MEKMYINRGQGFMVLWMMTTGWVILLASTLAWGDPGRESIHPELEQVRKYAPIIWPADDERLHPMMPHGFAFDGIDNNDNCLIDLDDPAEILADRNSIQELSHLIEAWESPPPKVLYHEDLIRQQRTKVYQYWFYYLFDEGLGAHKHDGEHAFVFVDRKSGHVRGVVGAGHTGATANNILVVGDQFQTQRKFPKEGDLPQHTMILVELGKHASAPDRNWDGQFNPGLDANLFINYLWGSRDIVTTEDTIDIGEFRQEHSYPRNVEDIIVGKSWTNEAYDELAKKLTAFGSSQFKRYTLFPIEDMLGLYERLSIRDRAISKAETEEWLERHKACFWGENAPDSVEIGDYEFDLMRRWPRNTEENRDLWLHNDFRNPQDIFKLWLFPTLSVEVAPFKFESGNHLTGFGLNVANIAPWLKTGTIGVHTVYDWDNDNLHEISLAFNFFRGLNYGLYGSVGLGNPKLSLDRIQDESYLAVSGGITPIAWHIASIPYLNRVPILNRVPLRYTQLAVRVGLRGEVRGPKPLRIDPVTFQISISFVKSLFGPKHPLTY